jgi:hypothetical protein
MLRPAPRRCRTSLYAVVASCALTLLLGACEDPALPSQVIARGGVSADTTARRDSTSATPRDSVSVAGNSVPMPARAELPRDTVDTTYPDSGRLLHVASDADLQAVIDSAVPGDVLLLPPGALYVGNFRLRDKGSSERWIVIRTEVADDQLGLAGTRMTPTRAGVVRLASLVSPNSTSALTTDLGAHHYRLTGLEITAKAVVADINALVRFGDNTAAQATVPTIAHHLVVDRSWVHGAPAMQLRRCIMLNSATTAVIDSWLGDCHSNVSDSQAIVGWNGPGPYLIQNNHLEAGHEVIMFGGGGVTIQDLSPSDIMIRGNHFTRPLAWKGVWQVKNLLETKHVRRLLIEGNVLENNWADAQAGFAFVIKSENQNDDTPWTQSTDITIRYNLIRDTGNGWNLAGHPADAPVVPAARITITDNVLENVNTGVFNGDGHGLQLLGDLSDVVYAHNTVVSAQAGGASAVVLDGRPAVLRLALHSNVLVHGSYGIKGNGTAEGTRSLARFAPDALVIDNVLVGGGAASDYPAENFFASSPDDIGFADVLTQDYRLVGPAFRGRGYDGRDIGADVARVDAETRNAVVAP